MAREKTSRLRPREWIALRAPVAKYEKGYMGRGDDGYVARETDLKLAYPADVRAEVNPERGQTTLVQEEFSKLTTRRTSSQHRFPRTLGSLRSPCRISPC